MKRMELPPRPHVHIIQDMATQNDRLLEQLRKRKVNTGQYNGEWLTAQEWRDWSQLHPQSQLEGIPLDEDAAERLVVVDLGPGTADPSIAAINKFCARVEQVYCIDTSSEIGLMAAENYQEKLMIPAKVIVADFLRDQEATIDRLNLDARSKVFLCLGNTAANYEQRWCFDSLFRYLVDVRDRMMIGLGLHEGNNADQEIRKLGELLCSKENLQFALQFLRSCDVNTEEGTVSCETDDDATEPEVKVVRGYYHFPKRTHVQVDPEFKPGGVIFKQGEKLQFTESRRYPKGAMREFFERHWLELIHEMDLGSHGLFLLKAKQSTVAPKHEEEGVESPRKSWKNWLPWRRPRKKV